MSATREFTVDEVLAITRVERQTAERLSEWATLRTGGSTSHQAMDKLAVSKSTMHRYERWLSGFLASLGIEQVAGTRLEEREQRKADWNRRRVHAGGGA